jgi:thiamine kinase-like enzyme
MWQSESVIHGDVRADNIMVAALGNVVDLRLVDWELWHLGDPAWDLAGLIEAATTSILTRGASMGDDARSWDGTGFSVAVIQATSRAIWHAYTEARGMSAESRREVTPRVVTYCAARIVQSTVELAAQTDVLPRGSTVLLQVAENVFADPQRAATEFFAIS